MKKLLLLMIICLGLIFLIENINALNYTSNTGLTSWNANTQTGKGGTVWRVNNVSFGYIISVTKTSGSTATNVYLGANYSGSYIATATFSGNTATFAPRVNLTGNATYYILADAGGGAYNMSYAPTTFPIYGGGGAYLSGVNQVGDNDTNNQIVFESIFWDSGQAEISPANPPSVILHSPANNSQTNANPVSHIANITKGNFNLINASFTLWFLNGTRFNAQLNGTLPDPATNNVTFNVTNHLPSNYYWNVKTCQGNGATTNCSSASKNFTYTWGIQNIGEQYNNPVLEQSPQTFIINLSISSSFGISTVTLNYNNTNYAGTFTMINSTAVFISTTLITPSISSNINISFYWNITFTGTTSTLVTETKTQQVNNFGIDDCTSNKIQILNFTLANEQTQSLLSASNDNTSIKIDMDIFPNASRISTAFEFSKFYNETLPARVCGNSTIVNSTYFMDVLVEYDADSYAHEYYNIQNYSLNSSAGASQNITLYDLSDSIAQQFKITFKDESFLAVKDALLQIQRKYVDEGVFKTIEIPKTDAKGESVASFQVADAVYTIIVTKFGEILATFDNIRAVCANQAIGDCTINLNTYASSIETGDFTELDDFTFTISYDTSTRIIQSVFTIPSGSVSTVLLNVTLYDQIGDTQVCSNSLLTSSGTLSCTIPNSYGNQSVVATVYKDGVFQGRAFIKIDQTPSSIYGVSLVFISIFLMMTLIGVGITDDPKIFGIFLIMGAILSIVLNLVTSNGFFGATATVMWLTIAIILVIAKSTKR